MGTSSAAKHQFVRLIFYILLAGWFCVIGFWLGPRYSLFGKLTWMTPADFVPIVNESCVPVVRAIKLYQTEHGKFPEKLEDMGEKYTNERLQKMVNIEYHPEESRINFDPHEFNKYYNHTITYDFTPGKESWSVSGKFTSGPIPLPPVTLEPNAAPATQQ